MLIKGNTGMSIFGMYRYTIIVKSNIRECYIKTLDKNYKYTLTTDKRKAKKYISMKKALKDLNKLRSIEGNTLITKFLLG